jgi:hypothetical protein
MSGIRRSQSDVEVEVDVPKWLPWFYGVSAVWLVPWIYHLQQTLPHRQPLAYWNITWVGFDLVMLAVILLVVYLALKKSVWLSLTLVSLCTLLLVDAWFDVLTSSPGREVTIAILQAVFIEIPWAAISLWSAVRMSRRPAAERG